MSFHLPKPANVALGKHLRPRFGVYAVRALVALVDFIRPEMKFSGLDQLKAQIAADGEAARRLLAG